MIDKEKYDADLMRLGRLYASNDISNSKCFKICSWLQRMKNKLIFWRK